MKGTRFGLSLFGISLIVLALLLLEPRVSTHSSKPAEQAGWKFAAAATPEFAQPAQLAKSYGRLPLSFEVNRGQAGNQVKFLSHGQGYTLFLTNNEAVLALQEAHEKPKVPSQELMAQDSLDPAGQTPPPGSFHLRTAQLENSFTMLGNVRVPRAEATNLAFLRIELVGAKPSPEVAGEAELPGKSNYFIGDDPQKWRTNIPAYAKVKYADVYPGVDLLYYGNQRQLEYDFLVTPGADPGVISLRVAEDGLYGSSQHRQGHEKGHLRIDANGDLVLNTLSGKFRLHKPVVYQLAENYEPYSLEPNTDRLSPITKQLPHASSRKYIDGGYILHDDDRVSFKVAAYDASKPLVIDPVLGFSTYLGGSDFDQGFSIATDSLGNAYVTGQTCSANFLTANAIQSTYHDFCDAFVTKLNRSGSAAIYSTYIGGKDEDAGFGIAVDRAGNAHVTGWTRSEDFPTANAIQPTRGAGGGEFGSFFDAFVLKLNSTGSKLLYSTYLGGDDFDLGLGIAVDPTGNAYVTGITESDEDFPIVNAVQPTSGGLADAFVAKLSPTGSKLIYSTYLGGSDFERGLGIAADAAGNAYVTGLTHSANFPVVNAIQTTLGGGQFDAFVAKLNSSGSSLIYSTFLGGNGVDQGQGIAADLLGNAYVTGKTCSDNFPTANAIQPTYQGGCDVFVTKLNPSGSILVYSTYLGGSDFDIGGGIAVDPAGNSYVVGTTRSIDFPTLNAVQPSSGGSLDAFVLKLNRAGSRLAYSTYLGGSDIDQGNGIAVSRGGSAYVTGVTLSNNFPTMHPLPAPHNALQGATDSFVAKIRTDTVPPVVKVSANPSVLWPPNGRMVPVTVYGTLTDSGSGIDPRTAFFSVVDEYGRIQPRGRVTVSSGGYSFMIALQAWRKEEDKNGRLYTIKVSAKDNEGNLGSGSAVVSVPHDRGD